MVEPLPPHDANHLGPQGCEMEVDRLGTTVMITVRCQSEHEAQAMYLRIRTDIATKGEFNMVMRGAITAVVEPH